MSCFLYKRDERSFFTYRSQWFKTYRWQVYLDYGVCRGFLTALEIYKITHMIIFLTTNPNPFTAQNREQIYILRAFRHKWKKNIYLFHETKNVLNIFKFVIVMMSPQIRSTSSHNQLITYIYKKKRLYILLFK